MTVSIQDQYIFQEAFMDIRYFDKKYIFVDML